MMIRGMNILIRDRKDASVYAIDTNALAGEMEKRPSAAAHLICAIMYDKKRPLDEREATIQHIVDEALLENEPEHLKADTEKYLTARPDQSIESQLKLYPKVNEFGDTPIEKHSFRSKCFACVSGKEHAMNTLEAALNSKITEIRGRWHEEERARSV